MTLLRPSDPDTLTRPGVAYAPLLVKTATQTGPGSYQASAWQLVPADTTTNPLSIIFPAVPGAGAAPTQVAVRWDAGASGLTLLPTGSDVFGYSGVASVTDMLPGETRTWQSEPGTGRWRTLVDNKTVGSLDAKYDAAGAATAAQTAAATDATTKVATRSPLLAKTVTKTGAYTAAAAELVPADTTGGAFSVTGPAWAAGRQWAVRWDAGTAAPVPTGASRADTCGTTSGVSTVTDVSIQASDQGRLVTGAGIPAGTFVGTVTAGVSFLLSSSSTAQNGVNATATAASVSLTISDVIGSAASPTASMTLPPTGGAGETLLFQGTTPGRWEIVGGQKPQTGLDLRHGRSLVPAAVGARPGWYDPHASLYVPTSVSIAKLRARLTQAATGALVNMCVIGDSKVAGYLAGFANSWSQQLRGFAPTRGIPSAGTGLVPVYNAGALSPMWTGTTGTWTDNANLYSTATSTGASKTFTSDVAGTVLELYYYNSSAAFSISIDGGGSQTVTPTGAFNVGKSTFSGLASTTHSIVITTTSASAVYIIGACVRNATGLLIHTLGVVGATSAGWTSSAAGSLSSVALALSPTIVAVEIGGNDSGAGTAVATYSTNLTTILGLYSTAARMIVTEAAPYASWPSYRSAQYDVSDTLGVPLIDQDDRWGGAVNATALGLVNSDNLHETAAGHNDMTRAWLAIAG